MATNINNNNDKKKVNKDSKILAKILKAPVRILIKARDFYVNSMTNCSGRMAYSSSMAVPDVLPKSFSVNSTRSSIRSDEDFRELMRIASVRSLGGKIQLDLLNKQQMATDHESANKMPRSRTVAVGRIDEEHECDFGDSVNVKIDLYPRSRSVAVPKRYSSVVY